MLCRNCLLQFPRNSVAAFRLEAYLLMTESPEREKIELLGGKVLCANHLDSSAGSPGDKTESDQMVDLPSNSTGTQSSPGTTIS